MKKFIIAFVLTIFAALSCFAFTACGVKAESIEFNETSVTLESNASQGFKCTVQPENARVKISISDSTVVSYEKGVLTALTAGTAVVKVYSPDDEGIYAECNVTVNTPKNYVSYKNSDCKFVVPSSWSRFTVQGAEVAFRNAANSSNINLVSESKNNSYFTASARKFKNTITEAYEQSGYSVQFTDCKVDKSKYLGYDRVHIVYNYSLSGKDIHQEQMILTSGEKTYILTLTYDHTPVASQVETIFSEFVGLK